MSVASGAIFGQKMRALVWIAVPQILCMCQSERKMMKLKSEDNFLSLVKFDCKKLNTKKIF